MTSKKLWEGYKRIIKDRGCIALFAQCPFDKVLGASNLPMLKYEWIWDKPMPTGRLNCNFAPLKTHENILIFSKSAACYVKNPEHAMIYNPQMTTGKPYKSLSGGPSTNYDMKWCRQTRTVNHGTRYPRDVQRFSHDRLKLHPTQKEYSKARPGRSTDMEQEDRKPCRRASETRTARRPREKQRL